MTNIALGKLPLEEKDWRRPEQATDGNITDYGYDDGHAEGAHPLTYTLDLGAIVNINTIRFLLWDGMGIKNGRKQNRRYSYELLLSVDDDKWDKYYQTTESGSIGWQVFEFRKATSARYVRLNCLNNTENKGFHIVEFEIHDSAPPPLIAEIINRQLVFDPVQSNADILKIVEKSISEKLDDFSKQSESILEKIKADASIVERIQVELSGKVKEFDKTIQRLNLTGKSLDFQQEADKNNEKSTLWLRWTVGFFILFLILVFTFLFDNCYHFIEISNKIDSTLKSVNEATINKTLLFEFISFLTVKALLFSISIYCIVFCAKNYRLQKHYYTINQHKALSLISAVNLLVNENLQGEAKEKILLQATNTIFSHQNSGYNDKDAEVNPNVFSNIIENVTDKIK